MGPDGRPVREMDNGKAWGRVELRTPVWTGATRYTRFGAWRKQTAVNAAAGHGDRLEEDENGPDAFAYSSLPQTVLGSDGDLRFPLGASATYSGETVAVQGTAFYTGAVKLRVRWHDAWAAGGAGRLTPAISGLRDGFGDRLTYADRGRRRRVDTLRIANVAILVDSGSVRFERDSQSLLTISHFDRAGLAALDAGASVEGKFVGSSADGPLEAIGLWTVDADSGLGRGGRMCGAFSAELGP